MQSKTDARPKAPEKKSKQPLNSVALLFFIVIFAAALTHFVPAGEYRRTTVNGRMAVDPTGFAFVEPNPATPFDVFLAVPHGMMTGTSLISTALLIGGGLECVQASDALNIGISRLIKKAGAGRGDFVLVVLFYVFALMGGFMGLIEGSIPFMPIAVSIALGLGYDSIAGVAVAIVGAIAGFTCGPSNPFTVGIAQTLAGLGIYSGFGLRMVMFLVVPGICLAYILRYARRTRANPSESLMAGIDVSDLAFRADGYDGVPFTWKHAAVLAALVGGIGAYVCGATAFGWEYPDLGAVFVFIGIVAGAAAGLGVNGTAETFLKGARGMVGAAFILGVGYGISWIFNSARILDTIVYYLSEPLGGLPPTVCAFGIFAAIAVINIFIPSASGKALIVMPIVLPIAQITGVEAQTAILAYQFGDGVTHLCSPLLGVLLLALSFGRVPFSKWERFILPLSGIVAVLALAFLSFAVATGYR